MTTTTPADPWAEPDEAAADTAATPEESAPAGPARAAARAAEGAAKKAAPTATKAASSASTPTAGAGAPSAAKKAASATSPPAAKTAAAAPTPGASLLSASLEDQETVLSILLYGPEGTGKTTDALRMTTLCGPKQKIVLADAEAGAKIKALSQRGVDTGKVIPWPTKVGPDGKTVSDPGKITYEGFLELLAEIEEINAKEKRVIGLVWDSGTEITKRILDVVVEESTESDRRKGKARAKFQVNLDDHGVASSMLRDLLRRCRDLGIHLVITALERRDLDGDTGKVKYGPAMSPAMANDAAGLVDIVGYTMVEEVGADATEVRSARFVPVERRRAKDRYGLLPSKLADPFFDRIFAYIEGDLTKETDPVQARVRELATAQDAAPAANTKE